MRRILKFPVLAGTNCIIRMPEGATITHVAEQHGRPTLWADCDDARPPEPRLFIAITTGFDEIPENTNFIGVSVGALVLHIYEVLG